MVSGLSQQIGMCPLKYHSNIADVSCVEITSGLVLKLDAAHPIIRLKVLILLRTTLVV